MTSRPAALVVAAALLAAACATAPSAKTRQAADIQFQLGAEALNAGRREDALRSFDEALKLDERHAAAHLGRGIVYQYFGKLPEAEQEYRRAAELDPSLSDAHNALGQLLAQTGRREAAIAEFDQALSNLLYRDAYVARCNKGQALYDMGKRDEGLAEIRSCLATAPRYCQGHRALGRILLEQQKIPDAVAAMKRYAELCERAPDAWFQLGLAQMRAGDPEAARGAFEKCESVAQEPEAALAEECRKAGKALQ